MTASWQHKVNQLIVSDGIDCPLQWQRPMETGLRNVLYAIESPRQSKLIIYLDTYNDERPVFTNLFSNLYRTSSR